MVGVKVLWEGVDGLSEGWPSLLRTCLGQRVPWTPKERYLESVTLRASLTRFHKNQRCMDIKIERKLSLWGRRGTEQTPGWRKVSAVCITDDLLYVV